MPAKRMPKEPLCQPVPRARKAWTLEREAQSGGYGFVVLVVAGRRPSQVQVNDSGVYREVVGQPKNQAGRSVEAILAQRVQVRIKGHLLIEAQSLVELYAKSVAQQRLPAMIGKPIDKFLMHVVETAQQAERCARGVNHVAAQPAARALPQIQALRVNVIELPENEYEISGA